MRNQQVHKHIHTHRGTFVFLGNMFETSTELLLSTNRVQNSVFFSFLFLKMYVKWKEVFNRKLWLLSPVGVAYVTCFIIFSF